VSGRAWAGVGTAPSASRSRRLTAGAGGLVVVLALLAGRPAGADPEVALRVFERGPAGAVVERVVRDPEAGAAAPVSLQPVEADALAAGLARVAAERAAALAGSPGAPPGGARLVPEDLTRRAAVLYTSVEGYTDAAFAEVLAQVGRREGFRVVARVAPASPWREPLGAVPGLTVSVDPARPYAWTEDVVEVGLDGTFHMTARAGDRAVMRRAIIVDRIRRFYPDTPPEALEALRGLPTPADRAPGQLPEPAIAPFPEVRFAVQGLVEREGAQAAAAGLAIARGAPLREQVTYLEGGNVLLGTMPDGAPYALVGRDAAAAARALLERHRGRPVGPDEARAAMARDLGVAPARLALVEQPWVFHLDLAMTLLAPGTVLLNDALEAYRLQSRWLREDHEAWRPRPQDGEAAEAHARRWALWVDAGRDLEETLRRLWLAAERFARSEARAQADLEAAGLTVVRVAGRFPHPARPGEVDAANLLNGEAGTGASGGTYFITQGGDARAERHVVERLLAPGPGVDRVYVAPRLVSRDTLWEKGGVGCRVKAEGTLALPRPPGP